ncbi:MAG: 50S ribosomal protein L9 [Candidatus Eisenbacteria bacterium]|nr:50S ribosomal protein L9 [Candidatus Latescibacterota bacterium]MBD3302732.1 50S ribosomal protein L9 [Candidatus Eisenbacteria bacterium]
MEVILLEEVDGLGRRGDKVSVAQGYARNYLLPRKLALAATSGGARIFMESERVRRMQSDRTRALAEKTAAKLNKLSVTVFMQAGEDDRLFGSVTAADISEKIAAEGYEIDKRQVQLEEPLKALGAYNVKLKLYQEVEAKVRGWVKKEGTGST